MRFSNNKPTMAQSRSGKYYRIIKRFCWFPTTLTETGDVVWFEKVTVRQKASFTMFGNDSKWLDMEIY